MADANRTLVTRAEYNTIIVPETGRRALVMDGVTIELGDTGWRDVTGDCIAGVVASGRLLVRRRHYEVTWQTDNLVLATGTGTGNVGVLNAASLAGYGMFNPGYTTMYTQYVNSAGALSRYAVQPGPYFQINRGLAGVAVTTAVKFTTGTGWGSTLPGVADGQPIGG